MKIKTRLKLSIILSLILIVTIGSFVFIALQDVGAEIEEARITAEIVKDMAELQIVTHEYLLHPTERSLMQWKSTYDNLTNHLTKETNRFESPFKKIALEKILKNIIRFKAAFSYLAAGFGKEQRLAGHKNKIPSNLRDRLIGELLVKSQATVSPVFQLQQAVQIELVGTQQKTSLLIVIFLIILAAFVTAISIWISKSIGGPIAELEKDIRIIGSGNLDHKVGTTAKDEIGQLSRSFDIMTGDLKETTASIVDLNKEIDERKQAEEALRESEARLAESNQLLAGVLEHTHMMAVFLDPRFNFIWVNRAYADTCKHEPSFFPGKNHFDLYPHEENQATFQHVVDTGEAFFVAAKLFEFPDQPERGVTYWDWSLIPVKDGTGKVTGLVFTLAEVTERKQAEEALRKKSHDLRKRVKELNCLYEISKLVEKPDISLDEIFQGVVEIIPSSWQHPEITCSRMLLEDKEYKTENFKKTSWKQSSGIFVHEERIGTLEVIYLEEKPEIYEGPFLQEERHLIDEIADRLRMIIERIQAGEQIKSSLKEKEILLREVHHRVKNNMQVVISLLRLQSGKIKDKKYVDMLKVSQDRIKSMALIHEKLYQSKDFANIDFGGYVKDLVNSLFVSHGAHPDRIASKIETKDISLELDYAIPCGLIINELISNSFKYAFPNEREGEIRIGLQEMGENEVELTVSDNGIGIPEDLDFGTIESMGLDLVKVLAEHQLGGKIELNRAGGTSFSIRFTVKTDKARI